MHIININTKNNRKKNLKKEYKKVGKKYLCQDKKDWNYQKKIKN